MKRETLVLTLGACLLASAARAQTPLLTALDRGDFEALVALTQPGLQKGASEALFVAGVMGFFGDGLPHDEPAALARIRRAADQDLAEALNFLGWVSRSGIDGPKDGRAAAAYYRRALKAYLKRAKKGDAAAAGMVSIYYQGMPGIDRDVAQAYAWMKKGAAGGDPASLAACADWTAAGTGVKADTQAAAGFNRRWFEASKQRAAAGDLEAMTRYGLALTTDTWGPMDAPAGLALVRAAAAKDYSLAQVQLAHLYASGQYFQLTGSAIEKDDVAAERLYARAAAQYDPEGLYWLGHAYENGLGVEPDAREAAKCYRKAADQDETYAMVALGGLYHAGDIGRADETAALDWYRRAAELGNDDAMLWVGKMYAIGWGAAKDVKEAARWFERAAQAGNGEAMLEIGGVYREGLGVTEDDARALAWYRRAFDTGDLRAASFIAQAYASGSGAPRDDVEATRWYRISAEHGEIGDQMSMGYRADQGLGMKADPAEALRWFEKSLGQWDVPVPDVYSELCRRYLDGTGTSPSETKALPWCRKAADRGDARSQTSLAEMYLRGTAVKQDDSQAFALLKSAVARGYPPAFAVLGARYEDGRAPEEAFRLYQRGSELGDGSCESALRSLKKRMTVEQILNAEDGQ